MALVEVRLQATEFVRRRLDVLGAQVVPALTRVVNQVVDATAARAAQAISGDTGLPLTVVTPGLRVTKATAETLSGLVGVSGRGIPLIEFRATQGPTGVTTSLRGVGHSVPHGFIARMRSGHEGVFTRVGRPRLPIREALGPSLATLVKQRPILERLRQQAEAELAAGVAAELRSTLGT